MFFQRSRSIITGYVEAIIEGYNIEKVINMCRKENILLENIKRNRATMLSVNIPVNQFKIVASIAKQSKCKIKIKKKKGLPFVLKKYKKRKIFFISLIILFIALISLSKFVWNIDVVGNVKISNDEILEIAKSEGLDIGKLKKGIDINNIAQKIRMERQDVSWVGIKMSGTNVIIEVVEADLAPDVIDPNEYCNIVATKDAVIDKIYAQNGTLQVKEGDVVKKGTILVSGWLEGKYTGTRYVHATGKVVGKVWYSQTERVYYKQKKVNRTGKTEQRYAVNINNFAINLYKTLSKFEIYDTIRTEKKLKISSNFYLPIKVVVNTNYEVIKEEQVITKDEAKEQAINEARKKLMEQIGDEENLVNEYINTSECDEYIDVEVIYEVHENIGTEEKIALGKDE